MQLYVADSSTAASIYLENQSKYIKSNHKVVLYVDARNANVYSIRRTMTIIELFGKKGIQVLPRTFHSLILTPYNL